MNNKLQTLKYPSLIHFSNLYFYSSGLLEIGDNHSNNLSLAVFWLPLLVFGSLLTWQGLAFFRIDLILVLVVCSGILSDLESMQLDKLVLQLNET